MAYYVDTHCHLDLIKDIKQTIDREDGDLIKTITVTNTPALLSPNLRLFGNCRNIRVALGLHPELAIQRAQEIELFEDMCNKTKYIGEVGLDGVANDSIIRDTQLKVFRRMLAIIKKQTPKILTVHSRLASKETIHEIANQLADTQHQIILHWYSGGLDELKKAIDLGFYISVNHKMAFSKNGIKIIKSLPFDRILTETDAPFTFTDSVINREQSLKITINELGTILQIDSSEIKQLVWNNFVDLLKKTQ